MGEGVNFSGALGIHVPLALYVALLLELRHEGVDGAGAEVDAEGFPYLCDYLITVHRLLVQILEDY